MIALQYFISIIMK